MKTKQEQIIKKIARKNTKQIANISYRPTSSLEENILNNSVEVFTRNVSKQYIINRRLNRHKKTKNQTEYPIYIKNLEKNLELANKIHQGEAVLFSKRLNREFEAKEVIRASVSQFFLDNSDIILNAFRNKETMYDLHYLIILKNDVIDNRNSILDFFNHYDLLEVSTKYNVYFHFVPAELADKIILGKQVEI